MKSALCLAIALTACASHATGPSSTLTGGGSGDAAGSAAAAPSHVDAFPVGPPLVTPGEHMSYKLQLRGIDLATYDMSVGDFVDVGGKKGIAVQSHAKAVGVVKMLANVDDTFVSTIDVATGRPLEWTADEYASKGDDKEHTVAMFVDRKADMVPITFHLNDQPPQPEPQKVTMADTWDFNSYVVAIRSWEAPVGSSVSLECLRSRYLWHLESKIGTREKLTTALGEFPALRFDGHLYKLARDGSRFPGQDERDFSIWISDDDGRVPLQITAKTDYGDMKMEITDYQPGNGQRLRN